MEAITNNFWLMLAVVAGILIILKIIKASAKLMVTATIITVVAWLALNYLE